MAALDFSPENLRKRWAELTAEYEKKAAPRDKLMAERDAKIAKLTDAEQRAYAAKIKKANEGLYEIEMERAAIARALGGKTGG